MTLSLTLRYLLALTLLLIPSYAHGQDKESGTAQCNPDSVLSELGGVTFLDSSRSIQLLDFNDFGGNFRSRCGMSFFYLKPEVQKCYTDVSNNYTRLIEVFPQSRNQKFEHAASTMKRVIDELAALKLYFDWNGEQFTFTDLELGIEPSGLSYGKRFPILVDTSANIDNRIADLKLLLSQASRINAEICRLADLSDDDFADELQKRAD